MRERGLKKNSRKFVREHERRNFFSALFLKLVTGGSRWCNKEMRRIVHTKKWNS